MSTAEVALTEVRLQAVANGLWSEDPVARRHAIDRLWRDPALVELLIHMGGAGTRLEQVIVENPERSQDHLPELRRLARFIEQVRALEEDRNVSVQVEASRLWQLICWWNRIAAGVTRPPRVSLLVSSRVESIVTLQLHYRLKWFGTWPAVHYALIVWRVLLCRLLRR